MIIQILPRYKKHLVCLKIYVNGEDENGLLLRVVFFQLDVTTCLRPLYFGVCTQMIPNAEYSKVVAESTSPRAGRFKEILGSYNPVTEPAEVKIDIERARYWMSVGAQPTDRVARLLKFNGMDEIELRLALGAESRICRYHPSDTSG